MIVRIIFQRRKEPLALSAEPPGDRKRAFLRAASRTSYYRGWLPPGSGEEALDRIPPLRLTTFYRLPKAFETPDPLPTDFRPLEYPLSPLPRIAVLCDGFAARGPVRVFPLGWSAAASAWRPQTVAGPVDALRSMASRAGRNARLEYPVLAFTGIGHGLLTAEDRDLFWRLFGVPVLEQFLGVDNEVLATECDAHEGLHFDPSRVRLELFSSGEPELLVTSFDNLRYPLVRLATGLTADLVLDPCGCGSGQPRLVGLRRRAAERPAAVAACGAT